MNNIEKYKLPSNGLLGYQSEVTIRGMKGYEISTALSSFNDASLEKVISNVIENAIDINSLCDEDKYFILHMARRLTYGEDIKQTLRCPVCGKVHDYEVSYDKFKVEYLDEEWLNESLTLSDGKTITKTIPDNNRWQAIDTYKEKYNAPAEANFILLQAARIKTIDGKKLPILELVEYLENLPGADFGKVINFLTKQFGINTTYEVECAKCKSPFTGGIGVTADLFR